VTPVLRTACPTDDLTKLWPALGAMKLELSQVAVTVDADDNDRLMAGAIMFHVGHELAYAGEFSIVDGLPDGVRRSIARGLIASVLAFCRSHGATMVAFNCTDPEFAAMAQRLGAKVSGCSMFMVMKLASYNETFYPGGG
jgi:hypothetical protein